MLDDKTQFFMKPIGYFRAEQIKKYQVPRQAPLSDSEGLIELLPQVQFEQALKGLEGFERIWILFRFHLHTHWKPKVLPPRGEKKQGVFATRSPHRPNLIGLSCVKLKKICGLKLYIVNHDLLEGTPILDIKPYLNYADSFQCQKQGWLDDLTAADEVFSIQWSSQVLEQLQYLEKEWDCFLQAKITLRLQVNPFPSSNNRIKLIKGNNYQLAYQTWRVNYSIDNSILLVSSLITGYDKETLRGNRSSRWEDVPMHQAFIQKFGGMNSYDSEIAT
ncbi:tRNA (N6-threonylcarbamoyladenosine(37)-N6)-methyltransferase TrmO [Candidatus Protochlamydia amoebophila]|nr:tRNA (N6-threonylcarbamoyladenosine(37)-N6)-methyltransferase TrmO [Candidatus Protochlamydia amoebophila]